MSIYKEDFISLILKMVCYNGVPLTFFSDQGFKLLNGKLAQSLGVILDETPFDNCLWKKFTLKSRCYHQQ